MIGAHQRHRQTDRRRDGMTAHCRASRGKNSPQTQYTQENINSSKQSSASSETELTKLEAAECVTFSDHV